MAGSGARGFRRVVNAAGFSLAGLKAAWRYEAAFRQECALLVVLAPLAIWLGQSATQRALLLGACAMVLVVELLNSAVEAAVDRVGTEHNRLAGRAKDLGSAAVFVSLLTAALVWALVAWERFG